jgi:hypothetical protein
MARRLLIALSLLACAFLGTAADASAGPKVAMPTVKSITPMQAQINEKLTISGANLKVSGRKTKVYFMREGSGVAIALPDKVTKTRIVVTIPESLIPLLRGTAEARVKTRFQVRVLAGKFGPVTTLKKSPVILPLDAKPGDTPAPTTTDPGTPPDGDCDGDGTKNSVDPDDDNDALADTIEVNSAHTDPCIADTEGDGVGDGYEYWAAKDINVAALPYPGKLPWPNPLDKDGSTDHDGDGLDMTDEFLLWKYYGNLQVPLNYSDGLQRSVDVNAPVDPKLAYMDMNGDGKLSDDERDGDGDGLTNWDESHGRMIAQWWNDTYADDPKETAYPVEFPRTSIFDPDSDGDTVLDGADDQDHDGLSNAFEVARPANWLTTYISVGPLPNVHAGTNPWARVQPYNPCKPVWSATCHLHAPFHYYGDEEDWMGMDYSDALTMGPLPDAPWLWDAGTPISPIT